MRSAKDIRSSFISFFEKRNHLFVRSSPLVPHDDPSLLFTNAGMNQFKSIFLGQNPKGWKRTANSQKCMRVSGKHNDLEEVGRDTYHHTFFEMLGNWSFGDYYKEEAIQWAWELLTKEWGLPKNQLYVTVHHSDDQAWKLWPKVTDLPAERVTKFGDKENFWEMGETGPCGPCSEIHIDLGPARCDKKHVQGHQCRVNGECARYIELWNLVFIQYNRDASGNLQELAAKHVDTGMGLERVCAVIQNVTSNYDTDLFTPIIKAIQEIAGRQYKPDQAGTPFRVIADHIRALSFAIADGAIPSNEGRGYVLRRLLRRAARFGREISQKEPFIYKLVDTVADVMGEAFPEITQRKVYVAEVVQAEEERFGQTLDQGIAYFQEMTQAIPSDGTIPGQAVFKLYDTYGFPPDLTNLMAEENGLGVDMEGYNKAMAEQRERARGAGKLEAETDLLSPEGWTVLLETDQAEFIGYETTEDQVHIARYKTQGQDIALICDKTPFYAESGGQVGDHGKLVNEALTIEVKDTIKWNNLSVHLGSLPTQYSRDQLAKPFKAVVDRLERDAIQRNHSATHLLQAALRRLLGDHVQQSGSRVDPRSLRFDFTHFKALPPQELDRIETMVNQKILANLPVVTERLQLEQAKKQGAIALFGEKYEDQVRMVSMGNVSKELCGGTHVSHTGEIGAFHILSEESVAAGVRRITAVTGMECHRFFRDKAKQVNIISQMLKVPEGKVVPRIQDLVDVSKELEREIKKLKGGQASQMIDTLLSNFQTVLGIPTVVKAIQNVDKDTFEQIGEAVFEKAKTQDLMAVLATEIDGKASFVCVISDSLVKSKKLHAGNLIKQVAAIAGGGGGGRPNRAQAGGKDPAKIVEALAAVPSILKT